MVSHEDQIIQLMTDETNRAVITLLNEDDRGFTVSEIAKQLVARGAAPVRLSDSKDTIPRTVISLHHTHLPRLDEAGLLEYDPGQNTAIAGEYPSIDAEWRDLGVIDELFSRFNTRGGADENAIGILEGNKEIYEYGRELADKAENELFLIYASDDLLDEECLPHAKNAIEREVELYAGTKSQSARTFFRDHLPEATVWDPQLDWLNDQSRYPKISRLIFADREKVIVSLWEKPTSDETKTEVAMIGEGTTNPLVVLTRELLGSRLDHLDYQSDDFFGDLPFEA